MEKYVKLYLQNQNNEKTKRNYQSILKEFALKVGKPIEDITLENLISWREGLTGSSCTIAYKVGVIKRFFAFLYDNDFIQKNISKSLTAPRSVNKQEYLLTQADVLRLIKSGKNARDKAIVSLMASTGLRVAELCNISLKDIDDEGDIKILGKGSKWRTVHVNTTTKQYIEKYLPTRQRGSDRLFVSNNGTPMQERSIRHTIRVLGFRIGIEGLHPHMLRHYFATAMLDHGVPIEQISLCMGHGSIVTTQRYAKIRNEKAVVKKVMDINIL